MKKWFSRIFVVVFTLVRVAEYAMKLYASLHGS